MSTDYTHFDKLAFNRLFGFGSDGTETLLINSAGTYVGPAPSVPTSSALSIKSLAVSSNSAFAGIVKLADGTANNPSLTLTSDPDTGLYSGGANKLFFATGGAFALGLNSTGQLQGNDGLVATPTYSFVNEQGSGIYRPGTGSIGIAVKGVKIATFNTQSILLTKATQGVFGTLSSPGVSFSAAGSSGILGGSNSVTLVVRGVALLSATTSALSVSKTFSAPNISGTNTGDQTITLTGNVTGSGTSSFVTTIASSAVTNVMIAASAAIAGSKIAVASTSAAGVISVGTQSFAGAKTFVTPLTGSNVASASSSASGVITTGTQSFAGTKTFVTALAGTNVASASSSASGVITTGTQSFAGTKTFVTALAGSNVASASSSASGVITTGTQSFAGTKTFVTALLGSNVASASTAASGVVTTGAQSFAGGKTFVNAVTIKVAGQNNLVINRNTNAGSSTSSVGMVVGNSGASQGVGTFFYQNAAATASPSTVITHTPRNNADNSNTDCARITLSKNSGDNGGTYAMQTATTAGTLTNAIAADSSQQLILGTGTAGTHRLNTLLATNGVQTATLLNLPAAATAGNAFGWITININGTTSYIPFWH